jgi:hypothetical protein
MFSSLYNYISNSLFIIKETIFTSEGAKLQNLLDEMKISNEYKINSKVFVTSDCQMLVTDFFVASLVNLKAAQHFNFNYGNYLAFNAKTTFNILNNPSCKAYSDIFKRKFCQGKGVASSYRCIS